MLNKFPLIVIIIFFISYCATQKRASNRTDKKKITIEQNLVAGKEYSLYSKILELKTPSSNEQQRQQLSAEIVKELQSLGFINSDFLNSINVGLSKEKDKLLPYLYSLDKSFNSNTEWEDIITLEPPEKRMEIDIQMAEPTSNANANAEHSPWKVIPSTDSSFNMNTSFFEPVNVNILDTILFSEWDKEYSKKEFEGKYVWAYPNADGSEDKRIKDNFQKANYRTFWRCKKCSALTLLQHDMARNPSSSVEVIQVMLSEDGEGERTAKDWTAKGVHSVSGVRE